ncbi:MAG: tyrosine-type recombinase/integrase [Bacteroidota bacterium]|nr:tyrosine-type recombinase/integrase [Bacteroidota bacterium]
MEREKFISYIRYEKRYSSHTVTAYSNDLSQFYSFLQNQYGIDDIRSVTSSIIRSWQVSLMENKISARSINRKLTTLKSFYKFLLKEKVVNENPMRKIISPKVSKKLPVFVEVEKMNRLLDSEDFGNTFPAFRDRMILETLYATGIRLSEIVGLTEQDIDFNNSCIKVLGKRNKERLIPFTFKFGALLKEYLKQKQEFITSPEHISAGSNFSDNHLFITDKGNKVYPKFVYRVVTGYLGSVTTLKKRSPHVLRHTFATQLLNEGAELNAVKELLGHANLSATQVYTHNTIEKLKKIYKQAHPKA